MTAEECNKEGVQCLWQGPGLFHSKVPVWQLPRQPDLQALLGGAGRPERLQRARHLPRKHTALAPLVLPVRLPQVLRRGL